MFIPRTAGNKVTFCNLYLLVVDKASQTLELNRVKLPDSFTGDGKAVFFFNFLR